VRKARTEMPSSERRSIVVLSDDAAVSAVLCSQLTQRYAHDYEIRPAPCASGPDGDVCADAALVLVDVTAETARDVLAAVRSSHPEVRRLAALPWGSPAATQKVQDLLHGRLAEYFVVVPQVFPDEQFHRVVSELLEEWSRDNGPGFELVRLVAEEPSPKAHRLHDLLKRNNVPHGLYERHDERARQILTQCDLTSGPFPVVAFADGRVLVDPTEMEVADAITGDGDRAVEDADVLIVGAGPAGLAAAVYATSEGLATVVLEREAMGGQAGTTSMIRNYLGFPRGITGEELANRAFRQAWSFGANVRFIRGASALEARDGGFVTTVSDGTTVHSRSVILAHGVSYRRIGVAALEDLVGAGVYYGAAVTEAAAMKGRHAVVVGGGNSAGQAAVHLAKFAERVTVLVRGLSLAESMSDYLIEQMRDASNVDVEFGCRVVGGGGHGHLEWIEVEDRVIGARRQLVAGGLFVLIGAAPATGWLPPAVALDQWGFVLTGRDAEASPSWVAGRTPYPFETSLPGVFAVGDVRHGSVKRVASAVGEGSACVQSVHHFLAPAPTEAKV
jgi:thioredoxin reductase (NADPH)